MSGKRENIWPGLLLLVAASWMAVYLAKVDPAPIPKWLQIIVHIGFLVGISHRVWRGRLTDDR